MLRKADSKLLRWAAVAGFVPLVLLTAATAVGHRFLTRMTTLRPEPILGARMKTPTSIPLAPGGLPLLGHVVPLLRDRLGFLRSLPEYGALVRVRLGPAEAVVVCDPGLTRQVLRDDQTFDKGGPLYDRARATVGDGLVACPYGRHRRQRRLVQPAFHASRLPSYAQIMTEQVTAVTGSWHDSTIIDVLAAMMAITSRTTAATMFSDATPTSTLSQTLDDVTVIFADLYRRMMTPPPFNRLATPANRRYEHARTRLRHNLECIAADRRGTGADHGDVLSALLAARDQDGGDSLTDTEVTDTLLTFFLAGTETTATTLAWALHLLACGPDIERELHAEVDAVLAGRPASYRDLPQLPLTGRIITETLRLWPPAWVVTRAVTDDTQLGSHVLPAGTTVVYSPYLIHHRADLYPDPERFAPDRWLSPEATTGLHGAFIPFGGGARKCIGDAFGTIEATLALATITTRWRLLSLPGQHVRPALSAALAPQGLRMRTVVRD